ncbi:hypothetical protein DYD21_06045 [Rhodohalobacter sp. SW132]|uniref:hypothetical protein n=1 Tax=Rhodohalobacter sp. SW132 TaxID=2293433 RepID=UPI000E227A01|nr:hypothetical protein [Rhodohalobacter sp. SW132]REL38168.1 hypothetical protein DYD21_06045 [Rhodohalobacter sp. SW132]
MNIEYIAVLDHDHLDNGLFLTSFAKAVASHSERGLILHSDSAYTDRIIQTGVMRADARIRAIKDLNHRLIALLADQGVSAIGLNGYQREMITIDNSGIDVDLDKFRQLPTQPVLLLSTLIYSLQEDKPVHAKLPVLAGLLMEKFETENLYLFTKSEDDDIIKKELPSKLSEIENAGEFIQQRVPDEFHNNLLNGKLTTATDFQNYPDIKNCTILDL